MVLNCLRHPWIFTAAVTAAAVASSLLVTLIALRLANYGDVPLAYALAAFLPTFAVPVTVYPLVRANRRLNLMKSELEMLALTDVLTGLPNRRAFFERAERIFTRANISGSPVAAMMADVDRFKTVNDTHGHNIGDTILCAVATAMRDAVASSGATDWIVSRLGGEEFAILVVGLKPSAVAQLAEQIGDATRRIEVQHGEETVATTVSVGVSLRTDAGEDVDTVLKAADDAVYLAKRRGRDQWSFVRQETSGDTKSGDGQITLAVSGKVSAAA